MFVEREYADGVLGGREGVLDYPDVRSFGLNMRVKLGAPPKLGNLVRVFVDLPLCNTQTLLLIQYPVVHVLVHVQEACAYPVD